MMESSLELDVMGEILRAGCDEELGVMKSY